MKRSAPKKIKAPKKELFPVIAAHEIAAVAALSATFGHTTDTQRAAVIHQLRTYIAGHGYMPDKGGDYLDLIDTVAATLAPERIADAEREMERIAGLIPITQRQALKLAHPSDAACNRWSPSVEAALFVGMALGVALIYNGGVTVRAR